MDKVCSVCGGKHYAKGLCRKCYTKDYREKRIKQGLCINCNNQVNYYLGFRYCTECYLKRLFYRRRRRDKFSALGLCRNCGKQKPLYTKTRCYECEMKAHPPPKDYTQEFIEANKYIENYLKKKGFPHGGNVKEI